MISSACDQTNYPNASRRQHVQVIPRQDEPKTKRKICNSKDISCASILTLSVACSHISASTYVASQSNDELVIFFAFATITVNLLLCYGAIFSQKEIIITWLAFYGILSFVAMSCFTPKNMKVNHKCAMNKNILDFNIGN